MKRSDEMSTLERADQIEEDFYRLKAQELGPKSDEKEIREVVARALEELYKREL